MVHGVVNKVLSWWDFGLKNLCVMNSPVSAKIASFFFCRNFWAGLNFQPESVQTKIMSMCIKQKYTNFRETFPQNMDQLHFAKKKLATMQPEKITHHSSPLRASCNRKSQCFDASLPNFRPPKHSQTKNKSQVLKKRPSSYCARCRGTKFWQSILCEVF